LHQLATTSNPHVRLQDNQQCWTYDATLALIDVALALISVVQVFFLVSIDSLRGNRPLQCNN